MCLLRRLPRKRRNLIHVIRSEGERAPTSVSPTSVRNIPPLIKIGVCALLHLLACKSALPGMLFTPKQRRTLNTFPCAQALVMQRLPSPTDALAGLLKSRRAIIGETIIPRFEIHLAASAGRYSTIGEVVYILREAGFLGPTTPGDWFGSGGARECKACNSPSHQLVQRRF